MCGFSSGYKRFSSYWWKHWFLLHTWKHPFVFAYQRVTRGYADCDLYSLDLYLASIIADAVPKLKDSGHPATMTQEKWNQILDDISAGFKEMDRPWDAKKTEESKKVYEKGFKLFKKHFGGLWY